MVLLFQLVTSCPLPDRWRAYLAATLIQNISLEMNFRSMPG